MLPTAHKLTLIAYLAFDRFRHIDHPLAGYEQVMCVSLPETTSVDVGKQESGRILDFGAFEGVEHTVCGIKAHAKTKHH